MVVVMVEHHWTLANEMSDV